MNKKNKPDARGFVFSTDPDFRFDEGDNAVKETLPPAGQKLKVRIDTKQRAGKVVTLVEGFTDVDTTLQDIGKKLKNFCGTGGSAKEGMIIIQGDQRDKAIQWLNKNGYTNTKKI